MKHFLDLQKGLDRIATFEEIRDAAALLESVPVAPDLSHLQETGFNLDPALNELVVIERLWLISADSDSGVQALDGGAEIFAESLYSRLDLVN